MATYLPDPTGEWLAAVRGTVVLVAPASAAGDLAELWPRLGDDDPTAHVLDRLTAGGLAATPSFALVVRDGAAGSARVVVRGELDVRAGELTVSGSGVSTWAERVVESPAIEVAVVAVAAAVAGARLPVVEGIVPARSVVSEQAERVTPSTVAPVRAVSTPSPTPTPTPTPTPPPAQRAPRQATIPFPPAPPVPAELTMVPAEDTIAGPSTPAQPMPAIPPVTRTELDGDHDGLTVASLDLRRLRAERAARADGTPASERTVVATEVRSEAAPTASLRMPDGAIEPIGHDIVLGRAPSVSQVSGGRLPRMVTIGAGDPDISRSHVRIAVEGDTVVITDLHSRNGTHVVAPGKAPVKLRAGEPTPVLSDTVVDLGGGWTVQVVGA
jgi:hypothetical protein